MKKTIELANFLGLHANLHTEDKFSYNYQMIISKGFLVSINDLFMLIIDELDDLNDFKYSLSLGRSNRKWSFKYNGDKSPFDYDYFSQMVEDISILILKDLKEK